MYSITLKPKLQNANLILTLTFGHKTTVRGSNPKADLRVNEDYATLALSLLTLTPVTLALSPKPPNPATCLQRAAYR